MSGEGFSGYGVIFYGTKKTIIRMLNVIFGNMIVEDRLTIRDSEETINININALNKSKEISISHLVEWEYCEDKTLLENKFEYRGMKINFAPFKEIDDTCYISFRVASNEIDWDNLLKYIPFDNIIVDEHEYQDYFGGWLVLDFTTTSRVYTNKNGEVSVVKPQYDSPWDEDFFPIHYGLLELGNLQNSLDYCDFIIEEESKKETHNLEWEKQQKKEIEEKIKNHLSIMSEWTGLKNDEHLIRNLYEMEYTPHLKDS